jgi:hypothetical protein
MAYYLEVAHFPVGYSKTGSFSLDNAANNNTTMEGLQDLFMAELEKLINNAILVSTSDRTPFSLLLISPASLSPSTYVSFGSPFPRTVVDIRQFLGSTRLDA